MTITGETNSNWNGEIMLKIQEKSEIPQSMKIYMIS